MTVIVNLYAGPGAGKSTNAARLFVMMKDRGLDVELVTEYAKELTWEESWSLLLDQRHVFEEQYSRLKRVYEKVDFIITDSPLLLSLHYGKDTMPPSFFDEVVNRKREFKNFDVQLSRVKPYSENGRTQSEEEARDIDKSISEVLDVYVGNRFQAEGSERGCQDILSFMSKQDWL